MRGSPTADESNQTGLVVRVVIINYSTNCQERLGPCESGRVEFHASVSYTLSCSLRREVGYCMLNSCMVGLAKLWIAVNPGSTCLHLSLFKGIARTLTEKWLI